LTGPSDPVASLFHHEPLGEQHPYEPLPWERVPREPSAGQPVTLGVETFLDPPAISVWCAWQVDNRPELRRAEAERQATANLWQVRLPAFSGGETVRYHFFARHGSELVESQEFSFGVSAWVGAISVAAVDPTDRLMTVKLATDRPGFFIVLRIEKDAGESLSVRLTSTRPESPARAGSPLNEPICGKYGGIGVRLQADSLRLEFTRDDDRLSLVSAEPLQALVRADGSVAAYRIGFESPQEEAFYGFGERFNALDQRGNVLDNRVFAQYTRQEKRSYIPVPFFISSAGYGVWLKTERQAEFDMAARKTDRWTLTGQAEDDSSLEMTLFLDRQPRDIVQAFTGRTGKPLLPPPWVFGPWMSSNDWNCQAEIARQLELAKEHAIPASVVVIEAWSDEINFYTWNDSRYHLKPPAQAYMAAEYEYPPDGRWPDPRAMIDGLHEQGMRLVLWQIPVLKAGNPDEHLDETQKAADQEYALDQGYVARKENGEPHRVEAHAPWFPGSLVFDFTDPQAAGWWLEKRRYLVAELGVDGFKTDGGEHIWDIGTRFGNGLSGDRGINTYPLAYLGAYQRFMQAQRGGDYVLFSRSGYTGVQKVSCHWTGDDISTWDSFRAALRAMLNVGLCGVAFIGWDIAGFAGTLPGSELYLRAAAFSVFCPIMQFHSDYNARRLPSRDRTPWNIQAQSGDPQVIPFFRKFANLRMNLVPYILDQARKSSRSGLPLMRALPLEYPASQACREYPSEYLFGEALLVAPVVEEGRSDWQVYLPEGLWRDLWTGTLFEGGRELTLPAPMDSLPVFQRRGSIVLLNLDETLAWGSPVGNRPEEIKNLAALIHPGGPCEADWIQDGAEPVRVSARLVDEKGQVEIVVSGSSLPVDLLVLGKEPRGVSLAGRPLPRREDHLADLDGWWTWLPDRHLVRIHLPPPSGSTMVMLLPL
jgi:alpha-D-xyloside xylohydrolase